MKWALSVLLFAAFLAEAEPPASVRGSIGYSAVMTEAVDAVPTASVEVDAPISLGKASIARLLAQLRIEGIAGKSLNVGDVRTFGSAELELIFKRRVGRDNQGGSTYVGIRGGGAALRNASGDAPYQRNPLWWAVEFTLERREKDSFPHRWVSVGFGHSDISSPPTRRPGSFSSAARDAQPRDLIVSGSVSVDGPSRSALIISGDCHRGIWGRNATTQVRLSTSVSWE